MTATSLPACRECGQTRNGDFGTCRGVAGRPGAPRFMVPLPAIHRQSTKGRRDAGPSPSFRADLAHRLHPPPIQAISHKFKRFRLRVGRVQVALFSGRLNIQTGSCPRYDGPRAINPERVSTMRLVVIFRSNSAKKENRFVDQHLDAGAAKLV